MHDLIVRGGTLVDGTGEAPRTADVAVDDGIITEVGDLKGAAARRTIDADGLVVTPGFVDIHTHYDGQVSWDPLLTPSSWHGVTTVVMGNCGVGFAPVRPGSEDWLIQLMEGVEDIPGSALSEGITWGWETFPDYLDAIGKLPRSVDFATQVPHGAVRAYVMGERGAHNEPATAEDIAAMAEVVRAAIRAGALGFSTSRTTVHTAVDGEPVPGTFAAEDELFGIGRVLGELGTGIIELAPAGIMGEDLLAPASEVAWMRKLSAETGRPISFGLTQHNHAPEAWREMLRLVDEANANGSDLRPQVAGRPTNLLVGWQTMHPFSSRETYLKLADLPLSERIAQLRKPEIREAILSEPAQDAAIMKFIGSSLDRIYPMGEPPNYEPNAERERRRHRCPRQPAGRGGPLRPDDGARRPRAADVRAARLLLRQPRRRPRDDHASRDRARAVRRRRPRRRGLRRQHPHLHAHPLGARPEVRPAAARARRPQVDA